MFYFLYIIFKKKTKNFKFTIINKSSKQRTNMLSLVFIKQTYWSVSLLRLTSTNLSFHKMAVLLFVELMVLVRHNDLIEQDQQNFYSNLMMSFVSYDVNDRISMNHYMLMNLLLTQYQLMITMKVNHDLLFVLDQQLDNDEYLM